MKSEIEKNTIEIREKEKMNILTNYGETFMAMSEIEGDAWAKDQKSGGASIIIEALKHINKLRKDLSLAEDEEKRKDILEDGYIVYGKGGVSRWKIYTDGTVKFSKFHCDEEYGIKKLSKVKEFGFEVY